MKNANSFHMQPYSPLALERRHYYSKFFFEAAKGAFLVLFLGGIAIAFTKPEVPYTIIYMIAIGLILSTILLLAGSFILKNNNQHIQP
jgi:hypothetical protein